VPIALHYLGAERYGLWLTLTSILAMFIFADLGLGNGLLSAIGEAHGKDDDRLAATLISSGFFMLASLAFVLATVGVVAWMTIRPDWGKLFSLQTELAQVEADATAAVLFISFLVALPLSVAQRVRMGYQQGFVNSAFVSVGSVLGLLGVVCAVALDGGLPWVAGSVIAAPLIAQLFNFVFLLREKPWMRPRLSLYETHQAKALLQVGLLFFVLQLSMAVSYFSDNLVIAHILGSESVTDYAVPFKLFGLAPIALGFVLNPLWPAYREAITRGDRQWVLQTLLRSIKIGLGFTIPMAVALVFTGNLIIDRWTGGTIQPSMWLLAGLGLFVVASGISAPLSMFFNGLNIVGYQVITALSMAILNIVLSVVLVDRYGIHGVIFGTVIAQIVCVFFPAAVFVPRLVDRLGRVEA